MARSNSLFVAILALCTFLPLVVLAQYPVTNYKQFRAEIVYRPAVASNNKLGLYNGTLTYAWTDAGGRYALEFPTHDPNFRTMALIYDYSSPQKGINGDYTNQYVYNLGTACGGCDADFLFNSMPPFFADPAYFTSAGAVNIPAMASYTGSQSCTRYNPTAALGNTPLNWIAVNPTNGHLCYVSFKDGSELWVKSFDPTYVPLWAFDFSFPADCHCGRKLDICVAMERSGSMTPTQWTQERSFLNTLKDRFNFDEGDALMAILSYNEKATMHLALGSGTSKPAVQNGSPTGCCSSSDTSCCAPGNSPGSGIRACADHLTAYGRPNVPKVILLLTVTQPDSTSKDNGLATTGASCTGGCATDIKDAAAYAVTRLKSKFDASLYRPVVVAFAPTGYYPSLTQLTADPKSQIVNLTLGPTSLSNANIDVVRTRICQANKAPCGTTCCGLCTCNTCMKPETCDDGKYCTTEGISGTSLCCSTAALKCPAADKCVNATCIESSRSCTSAPKTCPSDTGCITYKCNPTDGSCPGTWTIAAPTDKCELLYCDNTTGAPSTWTPSYQPIDCGTSDACMSYGCGADGKCWKTPTVSPQDDDLCHQYNCLVSRGAGQEWTYTNKSCGTDTACTDYFCRSVDGSCQSKTLTCKDGSDLCDVSTCDPKNWTTPCQSKTKSCPRIDPTNKCRILKNATLLPMENLTINGCNRQTGKCEYTDIVCEPATTGCATPYCDTSDGSCKYRIESWCGQAQCVGEDTACISDACITRHCDSTRGYLNCLNVSKATDCAAQLNTNPNKCLVLDTTVVSVNDTTTINRGCDATNTASPCVLKQKDCTSTWAAQAGGSLGKCMVQLMDPTDAGCCVTVPKVCNATSECNVAYCDPVDGSCKEEPKCGVSDACVTRSCDMGVCSNTTTACLATDPCFPTAQCDPIKGCSYLPIECNDNDECTADTCTAGQCVHTLKSCDDLNGCTLDSCDSQTGQCSNVLNTCDDLNACTTDSCVEGQGCVNTPVDVELTCTDYNLCTNDTCVPSIGCVNTPLTCDDANPCTVNNCTAFEGCLLAPVECDYGEDCVAGVCDTVINANKGELTPDQKSMAMNPFCERQELSCFDAVTGGVGIALGVGAVIGIIVGIVVCVAASGGGIFAYYKRQNLSATNNIANNPLYKGAGKAGENPLFKTA